MSPNTKELLQETTVMCLQIFCMALALMSAFTLFGVLLFSAVHYLGGANG